MSSFWQAAEKNLSKTSFPGSNSTSRVVHVSGVSAVPSSLPSKIIKEPSMLRTVAPTTVASPVEFAPGRADSAICSTAVWAATAAGLPHSLSGPAYEFCVATLPQARAHLKELGLRGVKATTRYLTEVVKSRFMAGNKVRTAAPVARAAVKKMPVNSISLPGGSYARSARLAPAAVSVRQRGAGKPRVRSSPRGVMISHTEMIGNLVSHSSTLLFNAVEYTANPGKFATFPWLSQLAGNFDKYVMHKLVVHLVSNQPTTTAGKIGIAFDYDSTDPLPTDRSEFFAMTHHVECAPWDSVSLSIPVDQVPRFVNSHTTTDSKLIDVGAIVVMADQIVATSTSVADIIVEYQVELLQPQQAIFTTMVMSWLAQSFTVSPNVAGPVVATVDLSTTANTLNLSLPQGYYAFSIGVYDAGGGSPTVTTTCHNAVGQCVRTGSSLLTGNNTLSVGVLKVVTNGALLRFVIGAVAAANCEMINVTVSRISATVYSNSSAAYAEVIGTF